MEQLPWRLGIIGRQWYLQDLLVLISPESGQSWKLEVFHRGRRVLARFGYREKHETRSNFTKWHHSLLRKNMVAGNQSQCGLFCSRGYTGLPETVKILNFPNKILGTNSEQAHIPGLLKSIQNPGWRVVLVLRALNALVEELTWVPSTLIKKLTIV